MTALDFSEIMTQVLAKNPYQHVTLLQDVFNSLGLLWSRQQRPHKSLELLQQAEELYKSWQIASGEALQSLTLNEKEDASSKG